MELILQVIFSSVFSALMLSAAIPNELYLFGCPFFTFIAFIPLYLIFNKIKNFKTAFCVFFLQTLTTHLISSFWLAFFKDFAIFTLGASALGTACIGGFFGLFFFIPYYTSESQNKLNEFSLCSSFRLSPVFRIIYFSAIYTLYEWVKSSGFLGYPWGTVSSAMFKMPVIMQTASITGTYGITFIIVMFNAIASEVFLLYYGKNPLQKSKEKDTLQVAKLFGIIFALVIIHGLFQYNIPRKPVKELTVITVQQNSDPWKEESDENSILVSQQLTKEKIDDLETLGKKADLVVWSEGCLRWSFPAGETYYSWFPREKPLVNFIKEANVPFIFGGAFVRNRKIGTAGRKSEQNSGFSASSNSNLSAAQNSGLRDFQRERREYFNSAILFDAGGNFRGHYAKNHLVPFAEALPFSEVPVIKEFLGNVIGINANWTPGDQYTFFDVPCRITENYRLPAVKNINLTKSFSLQKSEESKPYTVKIATPICFDDSFTDIMRPLFLNGCELFVNITDDSWSLKKSSEIQHFAIAVYRAIEYRTTLVRSANAGYSVVVEPSGKVISDLPLFQQTAMATDVPIYEHKITTYARFGNWLPYLCLAFFLLSSIWSYLSFVPDDFIPSERKIKKSKKHKKKNSKNKK